MTTAPVELDRPDAAEDVRADRPWVAIVWNDPINLMSYVTHVFSSYFHYPRTKAETLMLRVHNEGRAIVSSGTSAPSLANTVAPNLSSTSVT